MARPGQSPWYEQRRLKQTRRWHAGLRPTRLAPHSCNYTNWSKYPKQRICEIPILGTVSKEGFGVDIFRWGTWTLRAKASGFQALSLMASELVPDFSGRCAESEASPEGLDVSHQNNGGPKGHMNIRILILVLRL